MLFAFVGTIFVLFFEMCHFGHFVLIRFFFGFFSDCWQVSVCDCVLPFKIISSVQHPDSNQ